MQLPLFAIAMLLPLSVFCQDSIGMVKGRIVNGTEPVESASVALLKTDFATISDSSGFFTLKDIPVGKYQLRIGYVGFENYQNEVIVSGAENQELSIELIPLTSRLQEVVVTSTLKEVKKVESVTPIESYKADYFQRTPTTNLFDALYQLNGIFADVDNGVSNTTDVQINGLEGNYTMILIDGVPAMNGLAGIYAMTALPMSMVDKIEVLKGGASTLYGSEAIAGVINIKTKSPDKSPKLSTNLGFTSMLETNGDVTFSASLKKVSTLISASFESNNYRWDRDANNFTDIPLLNRVGAYNKWSFKRKDNRAANIYFRYLFEDRFAGEMQFKSLWRGRDFHYGEAITTHQWETGFQYELPIPEKTLIQFDYSEHYQQAFYGVHEFTGKQKTVFSQFTWNKKIDSHNEWLVGVSYRMSYYTDNSGLSPSDVSGYPTTAHIAGMFMEDEITILKQHKILAGIRLDYSNRGGPIFTPRLSYKWNSKDNRNILRLGAGSGYRVPNLLNEGFGAMNGSRKVVVEEELKPEQTVSSYLNYSRIQPLDGGLLNIDANVFYTYFFNFVNPDYTNDGEITYANNKQGATSAGFNLNADFTFNFPLKIGIGVTYVHTYEVELVNGEREKEIPAHVPPFVSNFYLSYNFPAPQLSIDWTGNLVSPMILSTVPNDFRSEKSKWFSIQNIQLTKKFTNGIQLYTGIKNLFNFLQKDPILRPFDPFNRNVNVDNPNNYRFDTTYGFTSSRGITGYVGIKYILP